MDQQRYQQEEAILAHYLPKNMYRFCDMYTSRPYLQAGVVTNDGTCFLLHFDLSKHPHSKPQVYVEEMLYTKNGQRMDSPSGTNHTLSSWNGWTQLCHYNDSCWEPNVSLWKVYIKCRLWLEMYRAHLRTGNTMEYYLNHQRN